MFLPKKISPCPIFQAIVEIRFDSRLPHDAIFGILFKEFQKDFPNPVINLPILQLPEAIRLNDPSLRFNPYYKLYNNEYSMHIGPKSLALIVEHDYIGWEKFSRIIKESFMRAKKQDVVHTVQRLGIRYFNFFDFDIFEKINLKLEMDGGAFGAHKTLIRTEIKTGDFFSNLQVSNNAEINSKGQKKSGSMIDIDTHLESGSIEIEEIAGKFLDAVHLEEKKLFFQLLKEDFIKTLNPE